MSYDASSVGTTIPQMEMNREDLRNPPRILDSLKIPLVGWRVEVVWWWGMPFPVLFFSSFSDGKSSECPAKGS